MASALVPSIDEVTVCELNGVLCTRKYDEDSKTAADKLYARVLGKFYPTLALGFTREGIHATSQEPSPVSPPSAQKDDATETSEEASKTSQPQQSRDTRTATHGAEEGREGSTEASPPGPSSSDPPQAHEERQQAQEPHHRRLQQRHGPGASESFSSRLHSIVRRAVEGGVGWVGLAPSLLIGREKPPPASLAWHDRKQQLAMVDPSVEHKQDRVLVFDLDLLSEESLSRSSGGFCSTGLEGTEASTARGSLTLSHVFQCRVMSLSWRPFASSTLAVGCSVGVCLWNTSASMDSPILAQSQTSGGVRASGFSINVSEAVQQLWTRQSLLARSGARFLDSSPAALQVLSPGSAASVTSLSWDPTGCLLAGIVESQSTIHVWEVSTGESTQLRCRGGQLSLLQWSPRGDCLVVVRDGCVLQVWDTQSWTSTEWEFQGHSISGLCWGPIGRMCIISFSTTAMLRAMYVAETPAGLSCSILPAEFDGSGVNVGGVPDFKGVEHVAWDPTGNRLALAFSGGGDEVSGLVGIYATQFFPVFQASLVGYMRGPIREGGRSTAVRALSFHSAFKKGALLSVLWGGGACSTYPLLFEQNWNL